MTKALKLEMEKSKKIAEMVKEYFIKEIGFQKEIRIAWSNDSFTLYIYKNDYDYNILNVKIEKDIPDSEYLSRAIHLNPDYNSLSYHKANAEEIYIINILNSFFKQNKEYEPFCYVNEDYLYKDGDGGETTIELSAIGKINMDYETQILTIEEMEGCKVIIDFQNHTMIGYEKEDDELVE